MTNRNMSILPLLATFQALLDHGGVSEAARALGVTQSAVSKHLAKLRIAYGDELFIRSPDGMRPTPHATWMSGRVANILAEASALSDVRAFDPKSFQGSMTFSTTDEICGLLVPGLLQIIEREAPQQRVTFLPLQPNYALQQLETGQIDLVISVNWHAPDGLKQSRLTSDSFVCLMGVDHPLAKGQFNTSDFANTQHVMVAPLGLQHGHIDEALAHLDLRRFVRLSVPYFSQITPQILGDTRVVTLPSHVARSICHQYHGALQIHPLPFEVPEFSYFAMWHTRFDKDPRHIWLRGMLRKITRQSFDLLEQETGASSEDPSKTYR
ncbi:transcriptional regulator, LysR family [Jannaschia faecimaris]|uniref:Transcriptional regulator, LysR family n=1 Tax=Jannaschia faecimaris TaxID=1244108 RepID=A0A1H3TXN8_9RHOB|nr:LysR family transcriptional regulator [Jannaschia faecimaris]SDZ54827.1 transcriptional regulator, LysR family [Jannaschia faecimaris]